MTHKSESRRPRFPAFYTHSGPVRMRVATVEGNAVPQSEGLPRLDKSTEEGFVYARRTDLGGHIFDATSLKPGVGSAEGDYE